MRKRILTNSRLVWAILAIVLSLCLALSVGFLPTNFALAEDDARQNEWVQEPALVQRVINGSTVVFTPVNGWKQGLFDGSYTVRAQAKYGNDGTYFKIYQEIEVVLEDGKKEKGLEEIEFSRGISVQGTTDRSAFRLGSDDLLPEYVVNKLKELQVGKYYLLAIVPEGAEEGTDGVEYEYTGINDDVAYDNIKNEGVAVAFTITDTGIPAEIELSIDEWTWGGYSSFANLISINLDDTLVTEVSYTVYTDNNGKAGSPLSNLTSFKTNESGAVENSLAVQAFSRLGAGKYWLTAELVVDGKSITASTSFEVKKSDNNWDVAPSALSWTWGEFDASVNRISGKVSDTGREVRYSVYYDDKTPLTGLGQFTVSSDGVIPQNVANILSGLDAGAYYIRCQSSSPNYTDIDEYIKVTINPVQNVWEDIPSLIGWSEGSFNETENALQGTAKLGNVKFTIVNDKDKVLYTVYREESGLYTVINEEGKSGNLKWLNNLSVGTYKLVAEVEGTNNYTALKNSINFVISDDAIALGAIIAVTVVFAVIDIGAAAACIILLIKRRRKVEEQFKIMVSKELHRG